MKQYTTLIITSIFITAIIGLCGKVYAQVEIDFSKYKPIQLQNPTSTNTPTTIDNKMIIYSASTNSFDTVHSVIMNSRSSYPADFDREFDSINIDDELKNFGGLVPADQIGLLTDYPIRTVVKLYIDMYNPVSGQTQTVTCSGVMIGADYVLTAGHCVDSNTDPSYAVAITVVPAYNMGSSPFGSAQMTSWYSFTQWMNFGDWNYDMAMLKLNSTIGNNVGWLGWGYNMDNSYFTNSGNMFHSFGYPGSDDNGNPFNEAGERMYYMGGYMDYWESSNVMCHYNIGYHGQSGSGLYYNDNGNRVALGVLSHGSSIQSPIHTCHCRMDQGMFNYFSSVYVGVDELLNEQELTINPNPSDGLFNLNLPNQTNEDRIVFVTDNIGRTIYTAEIPGEAEYFTLDLSSYKSGNYIVKATVNGSIYSSKIMLVK